MQVDFVHLHLLLNHFPIIGTFVGAGLFLISFLVQAQTLRRSSLIVLVAMALLAIPAFVTGVGAQVKLTSDPGISEALMQRHLGSAELSVWFMEITGALAAVGLWRSGQHGTGPRWNTLAIVPCLLITVLLMARTGNTGGDIRHSEIASPVSSTTIETVMTFVEPSPRAFTSLMVANQYWWAFMMAMHFVGLVLVVGTFGMFNLRVLGFAKRLPIGSLTSLIPVGLAGFGINVVTGMLAFIGMPAFYTYNIGFMLKIGALLLAMATLSLFYLTSAFRDCEAVGPGGDAPWRAKVISGASLVFWFAVIVLGRYIQPLENSISR